MKSSCGQGARKNADRKNLFSPVVVTIYAHWITIAIAIFVHLHISFVPSRVWEAWRVLAVSCCGHHHLLLCSSSHHQTRSNQTFLFFCILSLRVSSKHRGKIMGIVGIHLLWSETPLELKNPPHQRLFSWQSGLLSKQLARMGFVGLELCEVLIQRSSVVLLCSILATCPQHRRRMIHISSFHQWKLRLLTWQCNSYLGYFEVFFFAMFVVCLADISIYPSIDRILTTGTANILRRPF